MNFGMLLRLVIIVLGILPVAWAADDRRQIIERGKSSTAFVELPDKKSSGSAFCIHAKGLFVTNNHVIKNLNDDAKIKLTLDPNSDKQQLIEAKVLRRDSDSDLAILQALGEHKDFTFIPLGDDSQLFETMSITSFGFPFGKGLATTSDQYPDISVNLGRITALRKLNGKLERIQLDASLNPGNSGGPVCNEAGQIVGVVQSGIVASGVNFAIPVSKLREILEKPKVTFNPMTIAEGQKHSPVDLTLQIEAFQRPLEAAVIDLEVTAEGAAPRKFNVVKKDKNEYQVSVVPIPAPAKEKPLIVLGKITFSNGVVQGRFSDQTIKLGENEARLSEIQSIEWDKETTIILHNGKRLTAPATGLTNLLFDVGETQFNVDVTAAKKLETSKLKVTTPKTEYVLSIRLGKEEIFRQTGPLLIEGQTINSQVSHAKSRSFSPYEGESQKIDLPDTITDAVWGGGGRYLILHLKKAKKAAVYDVNRASITKYIPLSSENSLITAGNDKLIIVSSEPNVIERWSLSTLEKETVSKLPVDGIVKTIAMGYDSEGPLLIHWSKMSGTPSTGIAETAFFSFLDISNFEEIIIRGTEVCQSRYRRDVHIRSSGTGDVFGMWSTSETRGMEIMAIVDKKANCNAQNTYAGHIVPNYDGTAILTAFAGVFSSELTLKNRPERNLAFAPTTLSRFYVSIPLGDPQAQINTRDKNGPLKPAVYSLSNQNRMIDLPDYELGKSEENSIWMKHDFSLDKRVMLIPQANQLVTIPFSSDRLLVKRVDFRTQLDKAGIDYLYVTSVAPRKFLPGRRFEYAIEIASNSKATEFAINSGPEGMSISSTGLITWDVPSDFKDSRVNVIVSIKNDSQSLFETFPITPITP